MPQITRPQVYRVVRELLPRQRFSREQLHPWLEQRARQVVVARLRISRPVDEEARARRLCVVAESGARLFRELRRSRTGVPQHWPGMREQRAGCFIEIVAERRLQQGRRDRALRAVQPGREPERRFHRRRLRRERFRPRRAPLEGLQDLSASVAHPSLRDTTWGGEGEPSSSSPSRAPWIRTCPARRRCRGRCGR